MTEISAALVKQLRDATSAGMMDCKRALQETDGDFDEAVKLLREKGMASAAKRADRSTSEGKVGVEVHDGAGAIVAIGCETEPVSNNEEFLAYAEAVLHAVFARGADAAAELEDKRVELAAKLGENIQVLGAKKLEAADGEAAAVLRPHPGEQGRRRSFARAAAIRRRPAASRCTSRSRARRTRRATRCPRTSSRPSGRSSRRPTRCSRSPRTYVRRSSPAC